jgi:hypothetical protein
VGINVGIGVGKEIKMNCVITKFLKRKVVLLSLFSAMVMLSASACKQAGYQVLKPGLITPNSFDASKAMAPTARVEVIDRGISVTWVYTGSRVDIRPSSDTLDPNYLASSNCENPGITIADYELGKSQKPSIKRSSCSSLATTGHVFNTPGDYLIKMTVTSEDNETATSSMTLRVVARSTTAAQVEGGFTIHATPLLSEVNQAITFTGVCELKGKLTISWDYGNSSTGVGAVTQHSYSSPGQYVVVANCASDTGRKMTSSVSVVITDSTPPTTKNSLVPVPGGNPNLPNDRNCDPSQGPCQNATQKPAGGQSLPDKSGPAWYYNPFCRCYIRG